MDEAPGARVNAHVRNLLTFELEEQYVADPQVIEGHGPRPVQLRPGGAGHDYAGLPMGVVHQPAAIETPGRAAAVAVRCADDTSSSGQYGTSIVVSGPIRRARC